MSSGSSQNTPSSAASVVLALVSWNLFEKRLVGVREVAIFAGWGRISRRKCKPGVLDQPAPARRPQPGQPAQAPPKGPPSSTPGQSTNDPYQAAVDAARSNLNGPVLVSIGGKPYQFATGALALRAIDYAYGKAAAAPVLYRGPGGVITAEPSTAAGTERTSSGGNPSVSEVTVVNPGTGEVLGRFATPQEAQQFMVDYELGQKTAGFERTSQGNNPYLASVTVSSGPQAGTHYFRTAPEAQAFIAGLNRPDATLFGDIVSGLEGIFVAGASTEAFLASGGKSKAVNISPAQQGRLDVTAQFAAYYLPGAPLVHAYSYYRSQPYLQTAMDVGFGVVSFVPSGDILEAAKAIGPLARASDFVASYGTVGRLVTEAGVGAGVGAASSYAEGGSPLKGAILGGLIFLGGSELFGRLAGGEEETYTVRVRGAADLGTPSSYYGRGGYVEEGSYVAGRTGAGEVGRLEPIPEKAMAALASQDMEGNFQRFLSLRRSVMDLSSIQEDMFGSLSKVAASRVAELGGGSASANFARGIVEGIEGANEEALRELSPEQLAYREEVSRRTGGGPETFENASAGQETIQVAKPLRETLNEESYLFRDQGSSELDRAIAENRASLSARRAAMRGRALGDYEYSYVRYPGGGLKLNPEALSLAGASAFALVPRATESQAVRSVPELRAAVGLSLRGLQNSRLSISQVEGLDTGTKATAIPQSAQAQQESSQLVLGQAAELKLLRAQASLLGSPEIGRGLARQSVPPFRPPVLAKGRAGRRKGGGLVFGFRELKHPVADLLGDVRAPSLGLKMPRGKSRRKRR
jgi:hypothetical protein